ncbi:MAG: GTP pyrophosphokinase family protein [Clostridia bacterium]|nr:GTP pyrophosphokinase family protein [Clostridia bacterium]
MHNESQTLPFLPHEVQQMVQEFYVLQNRYSAALREVQTKLEILDDEFHTCHRRNPIHHIESRIKSVPSIMEKLRRKNLSVSMSSAVDKLYDIAGIRVVCHYVEDVYTVADLLTGQDDIKVLAVRDYISHPKANGYRSLHLIVEIPVFLRDGRVNIPVEVQLRTIAMDFWASLEHMMRYKAPGEVPADICRELQEASCDIAAIDARMQSLHERIRSLTAESGDAAPSP